MEIGAIIRKLRRGKDITQEQLAERLNVTAQAVSRWETGIALPDIVHVPVLANIFNVTTDELLGVDIAARNERIWVIEEDIRANYAAKGRGAEAITMLRAALKEYPDGYQLMMRLVDTLWGYKDIHPNGSEAYIAVVQEVISLGESIFAKCTDDIIRNHVVRFVFYAYLEADEMDKARDLALKMPDKDSCQNTLWAYLIKGTDLYRYRQWSILDNSSYAINDIISHNTPLDDGTTPYTMPERIALQHKALDIFRILFEDENYGFYHFRVAWIHKSIAHLNLMEDANADEALKHLKIATQHIIAFDTHDDIEKMEFTSLLFRGHSFGEIPKDDFRNESHKLLKAIQDSVFDPVRNHGAFIEIEQVLRQNARE